MRALAVAPSALATLALVACTEPSLRVEVTFAAGSLLEGHLAVAGDAAVTTVRVHDAAAAGAPLGRVASCDDVWYARLTADALASAQRAEAGRGGTLVGVPRTGAKLVVADVVEAGRRIGLGCEERGDIDSDAVVTVAIEDAPQVISLGRGADNDASAAALLAVSAWDPQLSLGRRIDYEVEAHDAGVVKPVRALSTLPTGGISLADLGRDLAPGPGRAIVRVRGAEAPLHYPLWTPWPHLAIDGATDADGALRLPVAPGTAARWAAGRVFNPQVWVAAVTYVDPGGAPHLRVLRGRQGAVTTTELPLPSGALPTPLLVTLPALGEVIVLIDSTGWYRLVDDHTLVLMAALPGAALQDAIRLRSCTTAPPTYLLRGASGLYQHTNGMGMLEDANALGLAIGDDRVRNVVCLGGSKAVVVEGPGGALRALSTTGVALPMPSVAAMADDDHDQALVAVVTEDGPHLRTFEVVTLPGNLGKRIRPSGAVDAPLATAPWTLLPTDGRGVLDGIASLPAGDGTRLQVVAEHQVEGEPLSARSDALPVGRAGRVRMVRADVDGTTGDELVVLAEDGAVIYRPTW